MKISQAILEYLAANGVKHLFGIPGGTVGELYDAINDTKLKPIIVKHEASAVYMATRYSILTRQLSACIVAGGVGAGNAFNGIVEAKRTKVPVLLLSGYVHTWQIGKGAAQEQDMQEVYRPITKYSRTVTDSSEVLSALREAVTIALTPPEGPVHLSIPINFQSVEIGNYTPTKVQISVEGYDEASITRAIELINAEEQGVILVGHGCRGFKNEIMELSTRLQWPIITTAQGKGIIPSDFPLNLGNYGFSGTGLAINHVENHPFSCVLVLGSSLGETATRSYNPALFTGRKVIHVDWDQRELGKVFAVDVPVHHDLARVLPEFLRGTQVKQHKFVIEVKEQQNQTRVAQLSLKNFFKQVVQVLPENTYYISDVGEFMMFALKYLPVKENGGFSITINYGSMGSGVGGAIGAYLANPNRPLAVFVGDGAFFMNGFEVLTAKEYKLPIIYFVVNNAMLGFVEKGQKHQFGRTLPDFFQERISFSQMLTSMGIKAMTVHCDEEIECVREFVKDVDGPCVIELITDGRESIPLVDRFSSLQD